MADKPQDTPLNIDDLLDSVGEDEKIPESSGETSEERRIRELEEELAKPSPAVEETEEFIPTEQLSPEQKRIRELEDRLARKRAKEYEASAQHLDTTDGQEKILLHFLEDGFTACGRVWYRGQELEFVVGSPAYEQQKDRLGHSWLDIVDDVRSQYRRYGRQMYARGPWPGMSYAEAAESAPEDDEDAKALRALADAESKRDRRAPLI